MHAIEQTETLLKLRRASRRLVHGSSPVLVRKPPAGVPFKRVPVAREHSVTVDPDVERNAHSRGRKIIDFYQRLTPSSSPWIACKTYTSLLFFVVVRHGD